MVSKFDKSSSTIKLVYEIKEEKIITIFGSKFVKHNKNKCQIIINNKINLLTDKYQVNDNNMKILKIKFLILNEGKINLSHMFHNCDSLKKFNLLSQDEAKLKENYNEKNSEIENIDISNSSDSKIFKEKETNIISNNSNINKNIYDNTKETQNNIYNLNSDFLSSKYSAITLINNNYSDYSLINDNKIFINFYKSKIFNYYGIKIFDEGLLYSVNKNIIANNLSYMFFGCSSLISISGLSKINTINVKNISHMLKIALY